MIHCNIHVYYFSCLMISNHLSVAELKRYESGTKLREVEKHRKCRHDRKIQDRRCRRDRKKTGKWWV
jgi:hypothetical protein